MQTGSYLELALTIYAWQVSNRLAEMIVASGLIYLPLLFIVWRNWSQTARSQEAKSAAPVSLRRMEQDVIVLFFTIIFAFLPAVSVTAGDIYYKSPTTSEEITGSTPDLPYSTADNGPPESIKIPILWWVVHQASAGFVQLFVAGVNSFGEPKHIRAISLALNYAKFNDPQLRAELQNFDRDCYLPALAKLEAAPPTTAHPAHRPRPPEWRGDDFWFDTPGYYDHSKATRKIASWAAKYDWELIQGKPVCAEWWRDPQLGLESRLYSSIRSAPVWGRGLFARVSVDPDPNRKRQVVRGFLQKSPPDINASPSGVNQAPGNKNPLAPTTWLGEAGILLGYIMTNTVMYIVTSGLPMVQAIILACVYIALPIAVPFATLRPGLLVFFISALFSLKFLTALWALSKFIDERMIGYMYDNTSNLVQLDSNDTVLSIITTLSYVGLPIVWLWLMSSFTGKGVEGVNLLFAYTAAKAEGAAQQATSVAQTAVSKGVTAVSKGVTEGMK